MLERILIALRLKKRKPTPLPTVKVAQYRGHVPPRPMAPPPPSSFRPSVAPRPAPAPTPMPTPATSSYSDDSGALVNVMMVQDVSHKAVNLKLVSSRPEPEPDSDWVCKADYKPFESTWGGDSYSSDSSSSDSSSSSSSD